jgi:uncharacterized membrane protein
MSFQCPSCNSQKIAFHKTAMKIGAVVGAVGGAAQGVSTALAASQTGTTLDAFSGPFVITIGTVSSAILGGLAGGVGGCIIGAQLGEKLDRHVLANNLCLACGHHFNLPT